MTNALYEALFAPHRESERVFVHNGNEPLTFGAFVERAAQVAAVLRNQGVQPGDRLVAQVGKSVSALAVYAGCVQAGVVYLPINTAYTPTEVDYFLADSGARLMLCDPEFVGRRAGVRMLALSADGRAGEFADAISATEPNWAVTPRGSGDLAALLYTSGTTGRSKGAMLSHDNLLSNARVLADAWQFTTDDVLLHALPIFHTHGLFVATNIALLSGASMIFEPKFDLDRMIAGLTRATTMMGVPTFYTRLLDDRRFNPELVRHMRLFISGSAPLLAETHRQFEERSGHRILERYGMTETNMNTSNPMDGERRAGSVGFPLPGVTLRIAEPDCGDAIPNGEIGQIEVKGPNVFKGYWNMPEKTAAEFRGDGYFITGDLGRFDEEGYVHIVGRNKDLIISGGFNIYPKEIELVLDHQSGVQESAVIGVPHPDFGEGVLGVLVPNPGATLETEQMLRDIRTELAGFKVPRKVLIVDELPRNTMGKVQKNALRERFNDAFSAA
ncbi:MAG: malonate--CoA ligase [Boseongicola sp.]